MRCLVISPTPTHPQDAGNRARIHALLSRLKAFGHRVELLLLMREDVTEPGLAAMRGAWDRVTTVPHDRGAEGRSLGETHGLDDWFLPPLEAAVRQAAAEGPYDLVLVEYVFLSRALEFFAAPTVKVLDTHDVFTDRHRRLEALGLPPGFFHTTATEEARGLDRADLVLAIQDDERSVFETMTRAAVATLGFMPPAAGAAPAAGGLRIGYLGSANPINARALSRFIGALDPGALAGRGAVLRVGGGASRHAGEPRPGLEPVGPVRDPADFLGTVDLVVNPHEGGTGLKIKTVEALAQGLPVLGTAEAFRGLGAHAAFHAAEDAAAVARLVDRWVESPAFRADVAAESAALRDRYARRVERQQAIFRDAATLAGALRRPRALMVTDVPFWRESLGNQARIAELVRAARGAMDFDVLLLGDAAADGLAAAPWLGARGRFLRAPPDAPASPERGLRLTRFEKDALDRTALDATSDALAATAYDLLIVQYLRLSYLRNARPRPPLVTLDTHDLMAPRTLNFEHFGREHFLRIGAMEEWEILSGFDLALSIQAAEHAAVQGALPGRSLHLPHTGPDHPCRDRAGPARRIAFVGGDSPMNRDGLRWFVDQVWPAVSREGAALHVAGGVCDSLPRPLPEGVVAHGIVDDLPAFMEAADLGVNPVFYGGGLKIKTVDYLLRGIPAVLSEEGAYGIGEGEGSAFLVARSRAEYVAHLQRLLRDGAHRRRIGEGAFRLGRRRFGRPVAEAAARDLASFAAGLSAVGRTVPVAA